MTQKPSLDHSAHFDKHEKSHLTQSTVYINEAISLVVMRYVMPKNCDWSKKITPLSNLTRASLLLEWKLTAKAELNFEIYKCWRKCWKMETVIVITAVLWAEKVGSYLEYCRSWKKIRSENLQLRSTLEVIQFEFWMKRALARAEICVLCG